MKLAPIVLFVYNRPLTTRLTLEALRKNQLADQSTLYVFADGPTKGALPEQLESIGQVREIIASRKWCKNVIISQSEKNRGLAESVIEGVTQVVKEHGKVIVLEDDIVTSPYFLKYLNDGLDLYAGHRNVYAINAYMFPIVTDRITTFLSPLATSTWGWATWADRWEAFERVPTYKASIQANRFLRSRFNLADYDYTDMLDNPNSWGIRWYYSVFARNGLGVFCSKTLCSNIGFGEDATHTKMEVAQNEIYEHPVDVTYTDKIDFELHELILNYFTRQPASPSNYILRMARYIKRVIFH